MEGKSAERLGQCTHCGGLARLIIALAGVTGQAGYELWHCDACGLRERLDPVTVDQTRTKFPYRRQRRPRVRAH
jgi:hypothetical protein